MLFYRAGVLRQRLLGALLPSLRTSAHRRLQDVEIPQEFHFNQSASHRLILPRLNQLESAFPRCVSMYDVYCCYFRLQDALKSHTSRQLRLLFLLHSWTDTLNYSQSTMTEALTFESNLNVRIADTHCSQNAWRDYVYRLLWFVGVLSDREESAAEVRQWRGRVVQQVVIRGGASQREVSLLSHNLLQRKPSNVSDTQT